MLQRTNARLRACCFSASPRVPASRRPAAGPYSGSLTRMLSRKRSSKSADSSGRGHSRQQSDSDLLAYTVFRHSSHHQWMTSSRSSVTPTSSIRDGSAPHPHLSEKCR